MLNQMNWSLGGGGSVTVTLTETPATYHCRSCCCRSCWGNARPPTTTGVRAKATAQGSSWSHLLQPPSHTAASDLPRMPVRAGPTWSEPLRVSPRWKGLPHLVRAPPYVPTMERPSYPSPPLPMHVFFQQHQAVAWQAPHLCTHPQIISSALFLSFSPGKH